MWWLVRIIHSCFSAGQTSLSLRFQCSPEEQVPLEMVWGSHRPSALGAPSSARWPAFLLPPFWLLALQPLFMERPPRAGRARWIQSLRGRGLLRAGAPPSPPNPLSAHLARGVRASVSGCRSFWRKAPVLVSGARLGGTAGPGLWRGFWGLPDFPFLVSDWAAHVHLPDKPAPRSPGRAPLVPQLPSCSSPRWPVTPSLLPPPPPSSRAGSKGRFSRLPHFPSSFSCFLGRDSLGSRPCLPRALVTDLQRPHVRADPSSLPPCRDHSWKLEGWLLSSLFYKQFLSNWHFKSSYDIITIITILKIQFHPIDL